MAATLLNPTIGLLGGTFDPPHNAHLALAQAARQQLALSRVYLMPAGNPWQKSTSQITPASVRLAMCQAAIEGAEGLGVEACETLNSGNTYTIDTLRALRLKHPDFRYTLIIGADQANRFDTWHNWREILDLCRLAVVARNGLTVIWPTIVQASCPVVAQLNFPPMDLSSSAIRKQIAAGQILPNQLPEAVERYIVKYSLYKPL